MNSRIVFLIRNEETNAYKLILSDDPIPVTDFCKKIKELEKEGYGAVMTKVAVIQAKKTGGGIVWFEAD